MADPGHEHLDEHGLIHMNGRIYDPLLARFLQADPFMEDTGTLNRYTYVHNNPLLYSDPSGYFSFKKWAKVALSIAVSVYSGGTASGAAWGLWGSTVTAGQAVTTVIVGGAISGGISSGTWDGAFYGAFSGLAFYNVGQSLAGSSWAKGSFAGTDWSAAGLAAKSVSHGLLGGALAHAQGGKFGHGFLSSGVSAASTPYITGGFDGNPFVQGALIATVGGTVSSITGGKFANGAVTAAMGFAFNNCVSRGDCFRGFGTGAVEKMFYEEAVEPYVEAVEEVAVETVDEAKEALLGITASTTGGASGHFFGGVFGGSISYQESYDTAGNQCSIVTACLQTGLGFSYGVGPTGSINVSELTTGMHTSYGIFGNAGNAFVAGGAIDFSSRGFSVDASTKLGQGASGGIQHCWSKVDC